MVPGDTIAGFIGRKNAMREKRENDGKIGARNTRQK
jgi:hypothetical protein